MRKLLVLLLILYSSTVFTQAIKFEAVIPGNYYKSDKIVLVNETHDTVISFERKGKVNSIHFDNKNYTLKKRRLLLNDKGDSLAYYQKHKVHFTGEEIIVYENRITNGWEYTLNNRKILEVVYNYNRSEGEYHLVAISDDFDDKALFSLQLCIGKFDKSVVMDYGNDEFIYAAIIIVIIVVAL